VVAGTELKQDKVIHASSFIPASKAILYDERKDFKRIISLLQHVVVSIGARNVDETHALRIQSFKLQNAKSSLNPRFQAAPQFSVFSSLENSVGHLDDQYNGK